MHKTYVFRTASNQKIEVDSRVYSFFRDITTVDDLKFLFTSKERLFSMETFELGFFNKATKQKEILNHDVKLCDLQIDEYLVIHVDMPKTTVEPEFVEEVNTVIETCVKTIVEKAVDVVVCSKDETDSEKAVVELVEKAVETVVDTVIEAAVDPVVEKVEKASETVEIIENIVETVVANETVVAKAPVALKDNDEEKVVEKKFCLVC